MKTYALRLNPGADLRLELERFTRVNNIKAGFIIACVGSLKTAALRMADETVKQVEDKLEIVSLTGTLSQNGPHLHIAVSDEHGNVIGGHLKYRSFVYTTAEIVIGELEDITFSRRFDDQTGFKELRISPPH